MLWNISQAQTTVFFDDFESGAGAWILSGTWGTTSLDAFSGSNSLTESPIGNYGDGLSISAYLATGVDLTTALDAQLNFWAIYDIEAGFDFMYIEASSDGGMSWVTLDVFDGEGFLSPWVQYSYSMGAFVGSADVRVRFRFESDVAVNWDGMYFDDVEIVSFTTDLAPPLILHDQPFLYEGALGDYVVTADIIDASGVLMSNLHYQVDGGPWLDIAGAPGAGDEWNYTIPEQAPGSLVNYWMDATDSAVAVNVTVSDTFSYIAGNHIFYDNGVVDFVNSYGPAGLSGGVATAVRISLAGASDLSTALIRNYTDPGRPNDSIRVHVWADAGGVPGADLITPVTVFPAATIGNPNPMTVVDLRPYSSSLSGITGDVWIGYDVPAGQAWLVQTTPGIGGRTFFTDGFSWTPLTDDYHFRLVTGAPLGAPEADFSYTGDPVIDFTDLSTNTPTSWDWDFGDGSTSTLQDPSHTYADNGIYTVCLTAANSTAADTHCEDVNVGGVVFAPVAAFSFDVTGDPEVSFTDLSTNVPDSWSWEFGDGAVSSDQNPMHTYPNNGTFNACLTVSNAAGSDGPVCQLVDVSGISSVEEIAAINLKIGPNPCTDFLQLSFAPIQQIEAWVHVVDMQGKRLQSFPMPQNSSGLRIDVQDLAAGLYWLEWEQENAHFGRSFQVGR
jgi:PKD repeat protein